MNQKLMKQKIIAFINAAWQWHQTGNGSMTDGVGLKMADLEEEILTNFGLPFMAFQYSEILQFEGFSNEDIEQRATALIKRLSKEAAVYLLSPIEKDEVILKQAKEKLQDAVEVLPMMGLSTSAYNIFLYYDFYFRNIITGNELISYLKKAETIHGDQTTRIPFTYETLTNGSHVKRLINAGFPFIKEYQRFLKYNSTKHVWNETILADETEGLHKLKSAFELRHFFIAYIAAKNEDTAVVDLLVKQKNSFIKIRVWCTAKMIQLVLLHAKYYSLSIPPMYVINPRYLKEGEVHLWVKDAIGKNIEIENIVIGLERIEDEDDEIKNPGEYRITYVKSSPTSYSKQNYDDGLPF